MKRFQLYSHSGKVLPWTGRARDEISVMLSFTARLKFLSTVSHNEVLKFQKMAGKWSSEHSEFRLLRLLNPLRIGYIRKHVGRISGLNILDVGCGCGLLSIPLAKLGANVTGIDACQGAIDSAHDECKKILKEEQKALNIAFRCSSIEEVPKDPQFDLIVVSEVIEHVQNQDVFLQACLDKLVPGGGLFLSTINKSWLAKILTVDFAENFLSLVPKGTHDPTKFFSTKQLGDIVKSSGSQYHTTDIQGVMFVPFLDDWIMSPLALVNYFAFVIRKK